MRRLALLAALALAACGGEDGQADGNQPAGQAEAPSPPPELLPPASPYPTDAWIGQWVGVEGLALDIRPGAGPGSYAIEIVLLDGSEKHAGKAAGDAITFEREGRTETIRHTDGAGTGLKWLADKRDCLVIEPGEGFCRD